MTEWSVVIRSLINPYLTNGFSHHYHLGESTFIVGGVMSDFYFLTHFSMKFLQAYRIAPDGTILAHQTEIATLFAWVIKLHLTQVFSPRLKKYAKP